MRADLVALTPDAVAALTNLGLVKRALREAERGAGPTLAEEDDGTVVGTYGDGAVARLPPGRPLREGPCTCGAAGVCRHLVGVALAYRAFAADGIGNAIGDEAEVRPAVGWSPSAIDDGALARALAPRVLEAARAAARRGVVVEVVPGAGGEPPMARLPACTVRFLVPDDLLYARCDCADAQPCAHAAIAVWAFRTAAAVEAEGGEQGAARVVEVRSTAGPPPAGAGRGEEPDALALALVLDLVAVGVVGARAALAQRFLLAREALAAAGHTWTAGALDDLELALERHRARSARYRAGDVLALAAEIVARSRASRAVGAALPASSIVGRGEAAETRLDHVRLVGLGCRFDGDERERHAEIFLADPDSGTVLVAEQTWSVAPDEAAPDAIALGRRRLGPAPVAMLAAGQITTRAARRRANRSVVLGAARGSSSVTPQSGDLSFLPRPLAVDGVRELARRLAHRPPRLLRPRVRAEDVHAIAVSRVVGVRFDPAEQAITGRLLDVEGHGFDVHLGHRRVAAGAIDGLGAALLGRHGPVRWVVGGVRLEGGVVLVEPTLVVADRVLVPDLEPAAPTELPLGRAHPRRDALRDRLDAAWSALEEVVQRGLDGAPIERALEAAARLEAVALRGVAARLARAAALARRAPGSDVGARRDAAAAVLDAAIRVDLAREAHRARDVDTSTDPAGSPSS